MKKENHNFKMHLYPISFKIQAPFPWLLNVCQNMPNKKNVGAGGGGENHDWNSNFDPFMLKQDFCLDLHLASWKKCMFMGIRGFVYGGFLQ